MWRYTNETTRRWKEEGIERLREREIDSVTYKEINRDNEWNRPIDI